MREEVCDAPSLLDVVLGVWLEGVDHVWEFHAISNEENGNVVANEIKVTFAGVEFDGETTGVAEGFWGSSFVDDGGEADNDRGLDAWGSKEISAGEVADIVSDFEKTLCRCASSVDDAFWDTFAVKLRVVSRIE